MKVLNVTADLVEVLWADDNEIEYIPYDEFVEKYGVEKLAKFKKNETITITKGELLEKMGLWANIAAKRARGEEPAKPGDKDYPTKKALDKAVRSSKHEGFTNENLFSLVDEIVNMQTGNHIIDDLIISKDKLCEGVITPDVLEKMVNEAINEYYSMTENLNEAEYHGRKVQLGKISRGDVKKYKVHVKNASGNVVKVNFGDPNMEIKRDNPRRRKNFRARHHCDNPGPRWKARYWACKTWSTTPVSKMV
jgi:hypothetical protein